LLLLAHFSKEGKPETLIANISQETLAEMIGTTRPRVSFFMNRFRKLGLIAYDSEGLQVHSSLLSIVLPTKASIRTKGESPTVLQTQPLSASPFPS
jgi:CRP/FNR family transcriptional regulator, cyclic AMP receptor protein